MTRPYVPQDLLDEAAQALRSGIPIDRIAGQMGVDTGELQQLLGLPQWRPDPDPDDGCDLWAADDLDEVL